MNNKDILTKATEKAKENGWVDTYLTGYDGQEYSIIFSHSFAKAFWGEKWRIHLQDMVIREEPLQYIAEFLEEE